MNTRYKSFDEIDRQLKILRLQREISAEQIRLNFRTALSRFQFQPLRLAEGLSMAVQQALLVMTIKKLRSILGK